MYSMVLMMALNGPAEAPSWGKNGCGGCTGAAASSGCTGAGCGGSSCGGGGGRSWGGKWGGRWGGGCCGGGPNFACHGAGSCVGQGYGPLTYYGFAGCYGSCYGSYTNYFSYWSMPPQVHYGYGMPMRVTASTSPILPPVRQPEPPRKLDVPSKKAEIPAPATIIVTVPAEATLFANGVRMAQTSAERSFVTPKLIPGEVYHYELTVEARRDGELVKETRLVEVAADRTIRVDFTNLATAKSNSETTGLVIDGK